MWSEGWILLQEKYYKDIIGTIIRNLIMVSRLDDGFVSTLNFLILIIALWLCKGMLFLGKHMEIFKDKK